MHVKTTVFPKQKRFEKFFRKFRNGFINTKAFVRSEVHAEEFSVPVGIGAGKRDAVEDAVRFAADDIDKAKKQQQACNAESCHMTLFHLSEIVMLFCGRSARCVPSYIASAKSGGTVYFPELTARTLYVNVLSSCVTVPKSTMRSSRMST